MWVIVIVIAWTTGEVTYPSGCCERVEQHTREVTLRFDTEQECRATGRLLATEPSARQVYLRRGFDNYSKPRAISGERRKTDDRVTRITDCANTAPPAS